MAWPLLFAGGAVRGGWAFGSGEPSLLLPGSRSGGLLRAGFFGCQALFGSAVGFRSGEAFSLFVAAEALEALITDDTVAFLAEPIQGEAGILGPPDGYWAKVREICDRKEVLFIADEIQSGLGRCGTTFCMDLAGVRPDIFILGKALGGGVVPVSAVVSSREILSVFTPGDHGSTFGGNPLAAAVGRHVVSMLKTGEYQAHTKEMGDYLFGLLHSLSWEGIREIRGAGLWVGIELHEWAGKGKAFCMKLLELGMLCKDTHEQAIRLAPPLVISKDEIDWAFERLEAVLNAP